MKTNVALISLSAIFVCQPLLAQETPRGSGGRGVTSRFQRFDRDGDGKLSPAEFRNERFKEMDTDGDGFLTIEEARAFLASGRAQQPATDRPAQPAGVTLNVVDAVFELCVCDVEACAKFYRDGIGMREVEPANASGALLEWAGCYLRLRQVPGENRPSPRGNLRTRVLASNGFRWFSLWFNDAKAIDERLVKAGYPAPIWTAGISRTDDPEGNMVEIMDLPRRKGVTTETFTWGMVLSDNAAARAFYGEVLALPEFPKWELMEMYLFATGAGRIKLVAPPGQRPCEAGAGPDAPGLRSVTLRVADLAAAREGLAKRGAKIEGDKRLLVPDPDGNRIYIEQAPPEAIKAAASRPKSASPGTPSQRQPADRSSARSGNMTPKPHKEEIADQGTGEPPLKKMREGDAGRDAVGRGQLFESICVPGITDLQEGMNGVAIVDLNKDGLLDIVATYSAPRGMGTRGEGQTLRVFINEGGFRFRFHPITIRDSRVTPERFARGQVPVLANFNGDGYLDLFVTRSAQMSGGQSYPDDQQLGNGLYVTDGAWDVFRDVSAKMGIQNEKAYNRQASIGDVNRDGWLDIAVGCDNIGNAINGFPHSRLYVYHPGAPKFENGRFADIGGTDLVPDFGGFYHDSTKDKAGPDINLEDLDNDGDLDLIQSYHVDVRDPTLPYSPVEYRQGVFCWKNLLKETGKLQFEKVTENGLACEACLKLSPDLKTADPVGTAPGLPFISIADANNDGLPDVLAVGPATRYPGWAPRAECVNGRFWRNLGGFHFEEGTDKAGLSPLNWLYGDWFRFFDATLPVERSESRVNLASPRRQRYVANDEFISIARQALNIAPGERRPYFAGAIFGDFNNDGWVDLVVLDRHESRRLETRAILFMNRGDGAFDPKPTTFSGLDSIGICGVTADLNNDGLLDLVFAADPDNSGRPSTMDRYESKVYWNTGLHGGKESHWLRLRFSGVKDAELIGARVEVSAPGMRQYRWIHPDHFYKSGCALEAHFGLGKEARVDVKVALLSGKVVAFAGVDADQFCDLNVGTSQTTEVKP